MGSIISTGTNGATGHGGNSATAGYFQTMIRHEDEQVRREIERNQVQRQSEQMLRNGAAIVPTENLHREQQTLLNRIFGRNR